LGAVLGIGWLLAGGFTALAVVAAVVGIAAIVSVLRNPDFSGGAKTLWVLVILILPILGGAVYFGVRSDW
jgi:hypothetical protein